MALRIKFRVTERADQYFSPTSKRLTFSAVLDESIPADDRVCEGTPNIVFSAVCDNPIALEALELGGEFYFDIAAVP